MLQTLNDVVMAYLLNALWQTPLLLLATECVVRMLGPMRAASVHRVWVNCLLLALVLPATPLLRKSAVLREPVIVVQQHVSDAAAQSIGPAASRIEPRAPLAREPQLSFGENLSPVIPVAEVTPHARTAWFKSGARLLLILYLLSLSFGFAKFAWGLWRTVLLLRRATPAMLTEPVQRIWRTCCAGFNVNGVRLLTSQNVASPATLTFQTPAILLPDEMPELHLEQMAAAFCHELAHVQRRDFLKNLLYELLALPLFFHPATHWIRRRMQETRELACDDMAAAVLHGRSAYASSLVRLAETMSATVSTTRALGVFEGNILEKRIMNLIETKVKRAGWRIAVSVACGALLVVASCMTGARFGVRPAFAAGIKKVQPVAKAIAAAPTKAADEMPSMAKSAVAPSVGAQPAATSDDTAVLDWVHLATPEVAEAGDEAQQQGRAADSVTYSAPPPRYADPGDLKPLTYKLGKTSFEPGDAIVIDELLGTGSSSVGDILYRIKGHYTLVSHDSALLAASVTTAKNTGGGGSLNMTVDKGDGHFSLWLWKRGEGSPHLSFYPANGGNSFASVYFTADPSQPSVPTPALTPGQTREVPKGWVLMGSDRDQYVTGTDKDVTHGGQPSAFLLGTANNAGKFGTLSQFFKASDYEGKRVRLRAWVRSKDVSSWAGLWMRVDQDDKTAAFDNMQNRAIKGSTDWKMVDVVLDVPKKATDIAIGILLDGPGEVWMSGVKLEAVGQDVAVTDMHQTNAMPAGPENLDFGK